MATGSDGGDPSWVTIFPDSIIIWFDPLEGNVGGAVVVVLLGLVGPGPLDCPMAAEGSPIAKTMTPTKLSVQWFITLPPGERTSGLVGA